MESAADEPSKNSGRHNILSSSASLASFNTATTSFQDQVGSSESHELKKIKKTGIPYTFSTRVNQLLHDWCTTGDTLFCIHPADGSLLIWLVDYLDDFTSAFYRQPQVSFASRIPAAFSKADADSLCWTKTFYHNDAQTYISTSLRSQSQTSLNLKQNRFMSLTPSAGQASLTSEFTTAQLFSFLVSAHSDGTLNMWQLTFSDVSNFVGVASVTHYRRNCGPRFDTTLLVTHPTLPLVISTSQNKIPSDRPVSDLSQKEQKQTVEECASELILWRSDPVGPLSQLGGVTETARISSGNFSDFKLVAWVPYLFSNSLMSISGPGGSLLPSNPCACFASCSNNGIKLHQVILDAKSLLSFLTSQKGPAGYQVNFEGLSDLIESEQSGSHSACLMAIGRLENSYFSSQVVFLHVYTEKSVEYDKVSNIKNSLNSEQIHDDEIGKAPDNNFYVLAVVEDGNMSHEVHIWKVQVSFDNTCVSPVTPVSADSDKSLLSPASPSRVRRAFSFSSTSHVTVKKICNQKLPVLSGIQATKFSAAVDVPTTFCQNDTCPGAYLFCAACSDGCIRLFGVRESKVLNQEHKGELVVIQLPIEVQPEVLNDMKLSGETIYALACANPLRMAWVQMRKANSKECGVLVVVAESERSGGESWEIEDKIELDCARPIESDCNAPEECITSLTWMSLENGSLLLSVSCFGTIYIYSQIRTVKLPIMTSASSSSVSVARWTLLNSVHLDGKAMTTMTWARDGVLLVGVKNELRVYSQWEILVKREGMPDESAETRRGNEEV